MRRPVRVAVVLAALACAGGVRAAPAMTEGGGAVATWVWHFDGEMRLASVPAYRALMKALPATARIVVGVTTAEDARLFRGLLELDGAPDPRFSFVEAGEAVSGWARDRYILFGKDGRTCLLLPWRDGVPAARRGDLAIAKELQRRDPSLAVIESDLVLEGGNILVTADAVLAGPEAISANVEPGEWRAADVRARLEEVFGRRLVVLTDGESPLARVHADMYLAVAGPRTLLLGDPRLAAESLADGSHVRGFGTFRTERQAELAEEYERIAERLGAEQFEVKRIPILHAEDGVILTWTNAVVDERDGERRVYLPEYGLPALDAAAREAWTSLGYQPVPIDAEGVIVLGGGLRCITNTVRAAPDRPREAAEEPQPR